VIDQLSSQGASGFVLDLRNSAGGSPEEALSLADLFVGEGRLGYLEGQTVEREVFPAHTEGTLETLPLVVLINEGTAEAAEIAAAAIRDNRRAEVVGMPSFGLGSKRELLPLAEGWALVLSVAKYYSPAGTEIQRNGVLPTVEVTAAAAVDPLAPVDESAGAPNQTRDRQLDRAIEILLEATAQRAA
jgi:carboxyl-terminal processing protease